MPKTREKTASRADSRNGDGGVSLKEAAAGVSPATLQRWARQGLIPQYGGDGPWSPRAVAHARLVARLRERGHSTEIFLAGQAEDE